MVRALFTAWAMLRVASPWVAGYIGTISAALSCGANSGDTMDGVRPVKPTRPLNRYVSPSFSRLGIYLLLKKVSFMSASPSVTVQRCMSFPPRMRCSVGGLTTWPRTTQTSSIPASAMGIISDQS